MNIYSLPVALRFESFGDGFPLEFGVGSLCGRRLGRSSYASDQRELIISRMETRTTTFVHVIGMVWYFGIGFACGSELGSLCLYEGGFQLRSERINYQSDENTTHIFVCVGLYCDFVTRI